MGAGFYRYTFLPFVPLDPAQNAALSRIPGVGFVHRGPQRGAVVAPLNAAWIVERTLTDFGVPFRLIAPQLPPQWTWLDVRAALEARGEVRHFVYDFVTDYQRDGVAFTAPLPGGHLWWAGGAGKTLALILWALAKPGPVCIVTKAAARGQWKHQVQEYTHLEPYVVRPASSMRKRDLTLEGYLERCAATGTRPFVILGWEALPKAVPFLLERMRPVSVGFDEAHKGKSHKRWKLDSVDDDGRGQFSKRNNIVAAAMDLSYAADRRLLTTATPVKDRLRDLYGQLDLAEPKAWGRYLVTDRDDPHVVIGGFTLRYCDAKRGKYGGFDTTGTLNLEELNARLSFTVHRRSHRETHRSLPSKRRQSIYLPPEEQDRARAGFASELKRAAKRGASSVMETRLAESASMKRSAVVDLVADALASGQKVVVFSGRHEDVEALGAALARLPIFASKNNEGGDAALWVAHGGNTTPEQREEVRKKYMAHPGPCVLVGTGESWGTAYDLQDTDRAIFAMLPWTGGDLHQWEARFTRHGQKRPVLIQYVICEGTVDEHVASRLIDKLPAMEQVAGDTETASAYDALAGLSDREAVAAALLKMLDEVDIDDDTELVEV